MRLGTRTKFIAEENSLIFPAGTTFTLSDCLACQYPARRLHLKRLPKHHSQHTTSHSKRLGRGIDYAQSRIYQPGDDIRHIDWRVTARTHKAHTKVFHAEQERPVLLVIDCSAFMHFGTKRAFKSVVASEIACLLAWATSFAKDRLGALLITDSEHQYFPPQAKQQSMLHFFYAITRSLEERNQEKNSLYASQPEAFLRRLEPLTHYFQKAEQVYLISDFLRITEAEPDPHTKHQSSSTHLIPAIFYSRPQQFTCIQIQDALELTAPQPNAYRISDGEHFFQIDTRDHTFTQAYQTFFHHHQQQLRTTLAAQNIPLWEVLTHDNVADKLHFYIHSA